MRDLASHVSQKLAVFKRATITKRRVGAARFSRWSAPEIAARRGGYFAARQKISQRKFVHASAGKHPAEGKRASLVEIERGACVRETRSFGLAADSIRLVNE